ncbi:MAG: hypothetical protein QOJ39_1117 [Candidatus Eremiobacteraeota bacterium]|jgi:hypothetical protein|nr:hypothetical protein [Candidatus Eremiobacteraeota bacterium]MEA2719253.1 hypothetical protein [Candidatus Eremiobacteraeota bacterium]
MNATSDSRRVVGALRFLADLSAVAEECAAAGVWDDELTARRRQRIDARGAEPREEHQVKAL